MAQLVEIIFMLTVHENKLNLTSECARCDGRHFIAGQSKKPKRMSGVWEIECSRIDGFDVVTAEINIVELRERFDLALWSVG